MLLFTAKSDLSFVTCVRKHSNARARSVNIREIFIERRRIISVMFVVTVLTTKLIWRYTRSDILAST